MIRLGGFNNPDLIDDPQIRLARERLFQYLRRPEEERAERRAPIEEAIFYRRPLADAVIDRCHGKCVFCERKAVGEGIVDHFRPWHDARDLQGRSKPHYYAWLAYEFDNLILICRECSHNKETRFPVFGERAPYIAPFPEVLRLEEPMLVDPFTDHAEHYFDFLCDGWCEPLGTRARATIAIVNLNRSQLTRERGAAIADLLGRLASIVDSRSYISETSNLFDLQLPFAGARLNILKRIVSGLTFQGQSLGGSVGTLARRFEAVFASGISDLELRRLGERIRDLPREDAARDRWDGKLELDEDEVVANVSSPWRRVQRSGGLAQVRIENFKGIRSLTLSIPFRQQSKSAACLMLLGENSVGKSSILQAIALALLGGSEARRLRVNPMDLLHSQFSERWDQLAPNDAVVQLGLRFEDTVDFILDSARRTILGRRSPGAIILGYGPRRFFDRTVSTRGSGAFLRVQTLFRPIATIPYPGTWLNNLPQDEFRQVAQVVRIVLALDDDDHLVRDLDGRICVNLGQRPVPLEWLSDGYRSVFVMVADIVRELLPRFPILQEAEAIVLIDEIETHLHPRWKMRVMSALRRALPNVQFIVTTHDPLCLRGMDDGEVVVLQRNVYGDIEQLNGLPSISGMRADQLLTSDYFGLSSTVDPRMELDMARYVAAIEGEPEGETGEADRLIKRLTIGDDAQEQVIHRAMRRFIDERERPMNKLRSDISKEAVQAVFEALKRDLFE